ncbi:MAG: CZB domain-containing protein [Betaproteobacteria bacterium]|nr:CZB domain-containing protein [Betaproteobacteria bacterium]
MTEAQKHQILSELRKAKAAHIKWRSYAYALVSGLDIEPEYSPLEHTDCAFGKWYHGAGQERFGHLDTYAGIDVPHRILHKIYHRIYHLAHSGQNALAEQEAKRLTELSRQVLESLELVEQEVAATA